jgi:CrcB protein
VRALVLVGIGGALGSIARYWCSGVIARAFGETFPWGTLSVNAVGSLLIGLFATLTAPDGRMLVPGEWRLFVMLGLLGGFTTFSSFSLQTLNLVQDGEHLYAAGYVLGSVAICLLGVWLGHVVGVVINR